MATETLNELAVGTPGRKKRVEPSVDVPHVVKTTAQDYQYERALGMPEVVAALHQFEGAQLKRDSISRKLCGGSTAVSVEDLARWEEGLARAKQNLAQIAHRLPILERHPVFASVIAPR